MGLELAVIFILPFNLTCQAFNVLSSLSLRYRPKCLTYLLWARLKLPCEVASMTLRINMFRSWFEQYNAFIVKHVSFMIRLNRFQPTWAYIVCFQALENARLPLSDLVILLITMCYFLAALLVRFLCHRFIGEYDPTIGKYNNLLRNVFFFVVFNTDWFKDFRLEHLAKTLFALYFLERLPSLSWFPLPVKSSQNEWEREETVTDTW